MIPQVALGGMRPSANVLASLFEYVERISIRLSNGSGHVATRSGSRTPESGGGPTAPTVPGVAGGGSGISFECVSGGEPADFCNPERTVWWAVDWSVVQEVLVLGNVSVDGVEESSCSPEVGCGSEVVVVSDGCRAVSGMSGSLVRGVMVLGDDATVRIRLGADASLV